MVLQVRDAVRDVRFAFRPVIQLRTGGVTALEAGAYPAAGELDQLRPVTGLAERLIQLDVRFAAEAARRATEYEMQLPLHLSLWADTVCAERDPLRPLLETLADIGRDPAAIVIRLVVPPGDAAPTRLGIGLARLRAAGFGVGLDAAGTYPMATLIEARAEVLLLSACHTAGLPATTAAQAALAGSVALATQTGAALIADGVDTAEHAAALRDRGARLVQGELLGPARRRPATLPIPAVVLDQLTTVPPDPEPLDGRQPDDPSGPASMRSDTAADLAHPAATIAPDASGDAARSVFAERPELTVLVLVDEHQRPVLSLNRDRFMLAITGPFGHSLYANRSAAGLGDPPRTLALTASLSEAIEMVADAPADRMYDDIVVTDDQGRCQGVLRVGDLVRDLAQRQAGRHDGPAASGSDHRPTNVVG